MSNQISEEAPDKKKDGTEGSPEQSSEKKIRQAVYDIRYRARREELDVRHAFSQYVGNSGLSQQERAAVKDKLFGKDGGGASDQAESLAIESVSNALFKVFESSEDTKYKIRVTDKEKGTSYVRYGDRKKITQLRSNPNISSVEMTGHGDPYEGDKSKKGEKTPNIKKSKGKNAEVKGKDHNIDLKKESYIVTEADKKGKKKKNKEERWQDSDGDGKWYEPGDDIKKEAYTVTAADKKGNTPAYQGYKAGKKNVKTGEPLYKAADHLNKEGYQRDPEQQEKERKTSKQSDPSKAGFTGISGSIATIMKQNAAMKKAAAAKKVKNEEFIADAAAVAPPSNKKITGEKVDNSKLIKVYPQDKSDPQIGNIKSSKETDGPVILEIVRRLREGKEKGLDGKACWKGYKLAGTKKKGGKTVDNCVKVDEAKVDAGKSPEQKEKDRNVRKFGVSHNVAGHGKLRRALHRSDRGDKKIKGDKSQYVEMESVVNEASRGEKEVDASNLKKVGRRNINRFETGTVKRTESSGGRKPTYKTVTLANPKPGYGKKSDHYKKNKLSAPSLGRHGTSSETEKGPQKHHTQGVEYHDAAQKQRRQEHKSRRGVKTKGTVASDIKKSLKEEDKAYQYVVSKLKKKYGDGVLTKGDKIKPKTAAQKKAAAAHQAKVDRENAAERAKDPSQGRYPPGYSNRGSD